MINFFSQRVLETSTSLSALFQFGRGEGYRKKRIKVVLPNPKGIKKNNNIGTECKFNKLKWAASLSDLTRTNERQKRTER